MELRRARGGVGHTRSGVPVRSHRQNSHRQTCGSHNYCIFHFLPADFMVCGVRWTRARWRTCGRTYAKRVAVRGKGGLVSEMPSPLCGSETRGLRTGRGGVSIRRPRSTAHFSAYRTQEITPAAQTGGVRVTRVPVGERKKNLLIKEKKVACTGTAWRPCSTVR